MQIGVNQFCFPAGYDVAEAQNAAARLGFDSFEACMTASRPGAAAGGVTDALDISGYYNRLLNLDSSREDYHALRALAEDAGIRIGGVGGILSFSIFPLTSADPVVANRAMDAVRRMADAARALGAGSVLVIPGMLTEDMGYQEGYDRAQARVAALAAEAPDVGFNIENVWNNFLYSPLELNRFVDGTGRDNVGIHFDIANARRFGYPQQWIRAMGKRIRKLHVKDYRMAVDNIHGFTNVLDGDVNYPEVLRALRETGYDGEQVVELIPPAHHLVERTLAHARGALLVLIHSEKDRRNGQ
jgi:hexulose-6-phosphate isomerase